jgi:hypothetical protein
VLSQDTVAQQPRWFRPVKRWPKAPPFGLNTQQHIKLKNAKIVCRIFYATSVDTHHRADRLCEALWSRLVALCAAKTHARFTESLGRALLVALGQGQERRRPPTTRFKHRQRSEVVELHAPVGATRLPDHSSSPLTRHEQRSEQHMTNHADVLRLPESDAMTLRHTARALLGRL